LHWGKIVAHGVARDLVKAAGARDLHEAFATVTQEHNQLPGGRASREGETG
jgi:hypothetical protein